MNNGKDICKELKAIRRNIAMENDIAMDIPECNYHGECSGTCPRCEAELQYLEHELQLRNKLGKAAMVAGVAFTLLAGQTAVAQTQETTSTTRTEVTQGSGFTVKGCIVDKKTNEPLLGCNILFLQKDSIIHAGRTDFDGNYTIHNVKQGDYEIEIRYIGYETKREKITVNKDTTYNKTLISLKRTPMMGIVSIKNSIPIIDIGAPESGQRFNSDQINRFPTP